MGDPPMGMLPKPLPLTGDGHRQNIAVREFRTYTANIPALMEVARSDGFFTVVSDDNGVIRKVPLVCCCFDP